MVDLYTYSADSSLIIAGDLVVRCLSRSATFLPLSHSARSYFSPFSSQRQPTRLTAERLVNHDSSRSFLLIVSTVLVLTSDILSHLLNLPCCLENSLVHAKRIK